MTFSMPKLGTACRHSRRVGIECVCGIGHPIEKIVIAANGGDLTGIAFMFPCRPGPECKVECQDYDPKTDEEIEAEKAKMQEQMEKFIKAHSALSGIRAIMVKGRVVRDRFDCPWCGEPRALHVNCAIDYNNHLSAKCAECGIGFIE